ncbi:hypothetical protein PhaeoP83_00052 [Phaeobacter inhibens]|uniref:Phage protein n=1 Tax=Phaeobacter inhibens TaxID=221822 RepID=A0ABM6R918_9RHOB|nr:hypothetical protein [Phaeobacter inhibens]AUQ48376.1 hypothetical protein PhaeoP83_00052 [Phaeobacter inhibens]AUQ92876.1 hypothetical protein PhaeoP66_00045 [Phaeobacter inhibens]AUR18179.1 hypothetical protein PhaeoP80_00052 [Phaeobacter inhibens]
MNKHSELPQLSEDVTAEQIFEILPSQATLEQTKAFLSERKMSFSGGSWQFMINQRLKPALEQKKITLPELMNFLSSAEEHGKQHVLLYKANKTEVSRIFNTNHIESTCFDSEELPPFNSRSFVGIPKLPTVSEVRKDFIGSEEAIVIKIVEKRHIRDESSFKEWEQDGKLFTSVDTKPYRAANIVRISESGLCEVRIFSHMDAFEYETEARALLNSLSPLIEGSNFKPYSLRQARHYVCDPKHRASVAKVFDLKHTDHLDLANGRIRPSVSGFGNSMLDNPTVTAAMDAFQSSEGTVHKAGLNVRPNGVLRRGLNLGLSGADNEFFLTSKVTREEYEYVFRSLLDAVASMAEK